MKTIFLDWNKTLSYNNFWEHHEDQILTREESSEVEKVLFGEMKPLISDWMRGKVNYSEICKKISEITGIKKEKIEHDLILSCKNIDFFDSLVADTIYKLSHNNNVIIATDNMDTFTLFTWPSIAQKYPHITERISVLNSFDLGHCKNDTDSEKQPIFFKKFCSSHSVNSLHCVLVDDSPDKNNTIGNFGITYLQTSGKEETHAILKNLLESN